MENTNQKDIVGTIKAGEDFFGGLKRICNENIFRFRASKKDHFAPLLLTPCVLWTLISVHNKTYIDQSIMAIKVTFAFDLNGFRVCEPVFVLPNGDELKVRSAMPNSDVKVTFVL